MNRATSRRRATPVRRPFPWRSTAAGLLTAVLLSAAVPATAASRTAESANEGAENGSAARHVVTTAIASPGHPTLSRARVVSGALRGQGANVVASARAQSPCGHCSTEATTVQVLSTSGGTIRADNSARAYTTGDWASSSAVSIQVITGTRASSITANNLAVAVNQDCTGCRATSVAMQFIVIGGTEADVSNRTRTYLVQIENQLKDRLAAASRKQEDHQGDEVRAASDEAADKLSAAIRDDTGEDVEAHVDIDTGH